MVPRAVAVVILSLALVGSAAGQSTPVKVKEEKPGLLKLAKISPELATQTALARVPTGIVVRGELEQEGGQLIYSFDIQLKGVRGIEEIHVDAMTGAVLKTEHEVPAAVSKEKAKPAVKKP